MELTDNYNLYQVPFVLKNENDVDIPNPEYESLKREYLSLTMKYQTKLGINPTGEFIGALPVTMENYCFKTLFRTVKGKFVYHITLKVDGTRFFLFCNSYGNLYFINRSLAMYQFLNTATRLRIPPLVGTKPFIVDGELVYLSGKFDFLIFDIAILKFDKHRNSQAG
jgi:hypothetical protein